MDDRYLVALYSFSYFGPQRTKLLISFFGSAKKAWFADADLFMQIGLKDNIVSRFVSYRKQFNVDDYFAKLEKLKIGVITVNDKNYPKNLEGLDDAPQVLYYRGNIKAIHENAVAIVGARKMTSYGREVTYKFSFELGTLGICIISGLALGVDAVAHQACIEAGGIGVAVLASGLDYITPLTNYNLAISLIRSGGVILSEYPLGHKPAIIDFPNRNRIISGLSKAVVVIEGAKKSGTLLTASHAVNQGKTVFAVPGQITSPMSEAPHFLISSGAKIAFSVSDIIDELNLNLSVDKKAVEKVMPSDDLEEKLIEIISREPLHLDEVVRISKLKVEEISAKLTVMQLKGLIKDIGNSMYKKI